MVCLAELSRAWLEYSADYRPSAFWFWNADMDPAAMETFVAEMARAGIREFLIHPSHGLEIEYLSDEYFDRYRLGLELGKKHGLKVWVYDEFAWPSGVAGGKLLWEHPEFGGWSLRFRKDEAGTVIARPEKLNSVLDNVVGAPWIKPIAGYLDLLSPTAVRCFIEMTYERVYRECKQYFGDVITGFFTDEPALMFGCDQAPHGAWGAAALPWTPQLPALFKKRFGYDIELRYAELADAGPSKIRREYWQLVKELHADAFHGQIGRWCRNHGVKYTGHLGEDSPLQEVRFAGSPFACLSHMDEPGIDFLGYDLEPEGRFWEQVLISSIARHAGRKRVFCEAFGTSGFNLRLGAMFRRGQMMGIHGIDDIALMAFFQKTDGIRKRTYWPPLFTNAPWWDFYPAFRDAMARSVALTALGRRRAKYAVLYPQNQLEQTDPFISPWAGTDVATPIIERLGRAVYGAHETFEIIFPEILDQARVENGRIVFPYAEYEAILVPAEVEYFETSTAALKRIAAVGGRVIADTMQKIEEDFRMQVSPSWGNVLKISEAKGFRVYRFDYPDGMLFALRNVTDTASTVTVSSSKTLTEWDPVLGRCFNPGSQVQWLVPGRGTRYVTVSDQFLADPEITPSATVPLNTEWLLAADRPNMARLAGIQFFDEQAGWVNPVKWGFSREENPRFMLTLPDLFKGRTQIPMRAEFSCDSIPDQLGLLFERDHLTALAVNGKAVDLATAIPLPVWDDSCVLVDILRHVQPGKNTLIGTLKYQAWETSIQNDGFFAKPLLPSCDMALAGTFRLTGNSLAKDSKQPVTLPVDLARAGWEQYAGILNLIANFTVDAALAKSVVALQVDPISEDALELILDGRSLGKQFLQPYRFDLPSLTPGLHEIILRLASTSANILDTPDPWGINSVSLLTKE